jgi:prepilin-type N-terminal cleavage/methylation domain-containing protein
MRRSYLSSFLRQKGFTLIEVMVTLVILSVSLLALAALMGATIRNTSNSGHVTEATTFAQDKLEELKAGGWKKLSDGTYTDDLQGSTGVHYARRWIAATDGHLKTVTVSVTWADCIHHSIRLFSVMSP